MASRLFKMRTPESIISYLRLRNLLALTSRPTMKIKWHLVKQVLKSLHIEKQIQEIEIPLSA